MNLIRLYAKRDGKIRDPLANFHDDLVDIYGLQMMAGFFRSTELGQGEVPQTMDYRLYKWESAGSCGAVHTYVVTEVNSLESLHRVSILIDLPPLPIMAAEHKIAESLDDMSEDHRDFVLLRDRYFVPYLDTPPDLDQISDHFRTPAAGVSREGVRSAAQEVVAAVEALHTDTKRAL